MFLLHLVEVSRSPEDSRWLFRLSLIPLVFIYGVLARIFGWSIWGGVLVAIAEVPLLFIVDRIVKSRLHLEFRKRFNPFNNPFSPLPKHVTQTDVDVFLEVIAWRLKSLTEEQRQVADGHKTLPNGFTQANILVINEWVAGALKYYWRAYWLAKIFKYEVKKSWKEYLPTHTA